MSDIFSIIKNVGIIPVLEIESEKSAVSVANAILKGGINCIEVTFRTESAEKVIKKITAEVPSMHVGAGTVLTTSQVDKAIENGCEFVVSPGFNPDIIMYAQKKGIPIIPGTATPGEIEKAMQLGLNTVKFFPAENLGGLPFLKSLSGPYKNIQFMPTGGINSSNLSDYIQFSKVVACGGSWIASKKLIKEKKYNDITKLALEARKQVLGFKVVHIGINCSDSCEASHVADTFTSMFNMDSDENSNSIFVGDHSIEIMKAPYLGKHGHIAIKTNSLTRAISYFEALGYNINSSTVTDKIAYLSDEIGGFAIHLVEG